MSRHWLIPVVLLLFVGLFAGGAWAANIFVATTGNDSTGTEVSGSPYATLAKAAGLAVAGDTIQVRSGTYAQHFTWTGVGSPAAYITMQAYDGDRTTVITGDSGSQITLDMSGCQYVKLIGFDLSGSGSTGNYYVLKTDTNSQYCEISRCYIHNSSAGRRG